MRTLILRNPGGGGGGGVDTHAVGMQQLAAEKAAKEQQQQWEADQAQANQAAQSTEDLQNKQLSQSQQQQNQDAENYQKSSMAQGQAAGATGGPNGVKAAATMSGSTLNPLDSKLQAAGIGLPGVDSLANLLKKRTLSQSNVVSPASGNSLQSSGATLG